MKITVVVPTHNRSRLLARTITSLAEQDLAPMEVVVVDNACTDDTQAVVQGLAKHVRRLRYVVEPQLGVSHARNRGAAEANGELVVFIDDDAVASRGWLGALTLAAQDSPGAAAVAGPIDLRWPRAAPSWVRGLEGWYGRYDLGAERRTIDYPLYPFGSNLALRREAFLSVGGFPGELGPRGSVRIANEEDGLFRRVAARGWTVIYEPDALVYHWVHSERLSRRYLLRRAFTQGRSDVLADALFVAGRTRPRRASRTASALADTASAGRAALLNRARMSAVVEASASLGRAARDAGLSVRVRGLPGAAASNGSAGGSAGLTVEQLEQFDRDGFVRVPGAFEGAEAMEDRVWRFFERRGIDRDHPATWPRGEARHLQKLLRESVFMSIGGPRTSAVIDDLLGQGLWNRPEHWGELLVTFPEPDRTWNVPTLWHTDANYDDPLQPLRGVMVFSFLNRVSHRHGGTLVLAGSHRLVARFASRHPEVSREHSAATRRQFYASHPWLTALLEDGGAPDRYERFSSEVDVDGLPARLAELTGEAGDIVITHPLIAHCVSPNSGTQPRFMRIIRPRVRS